MAVIEAGKGAQPEVTEYWLTEGQAWPYSVADSRELHGRTSDQLGKRVDDELLVGAPRNSHRKSSAGWVNENGSQVHVRPRD